MFLSPTRRLSYLGQDIRLEAFLDLSLTQLTVRFATIHHLGLLPGKARLLLLQGGDVIILIVLLVIVLPRLMIASLRLSHSTGRCISSRASRCASCRIAYHICGLSCRGRGGTSRVT